MAQSGQSYGKTLPDQVDRIADVFDAHLSLIADIRELYRERVLLDRDYALKLQTLARKASEKKARLTSVLVLGNEPTKVWDENTLRSSTLDNVYAQIIASMTLSAQDHVTLADAITLQVTDVLKQVEKKSEESKRKQITFYQKLLSERDKTYSERTKMKSKYDEECVEVETYRQKQSHTGDKHADRAAKQYEQQQIDMANSKNLYLISISVANSTKEKFYGEDLPVLEDSFQDLQTRLINRFVQIMLHAQDLQVRHQDGLKGRISAVQATVGEVNPIRDQDLFIDHNIRPFTAPADWVFEPCASHYDTSEMNIDVAPKVFLQNKLARCRDQLQTIMSSIEFQRREVQKYAQLVAAYRADRVIGDIDDLSDTFLAATQQLAFSVSSEQNLKAEIDVISAALGGDEGAQMPHSFKSSSFSIPTQCGYCKSSIWGLSKQGKTCKTCGLCVHAKCELKVPAECKGSAGGHNSAASVTRTTTRTSVTSSISNNPAPGSSSGQPSALHRAQESQHAARVIFDFTPTSPFELEISEGTMVRVLEEDDGSGWIKVIDEHGGKGLVPASYVEMSEGGDEAPSTVQSQSRQPQKTYVRGVYAYQPQGSDELGVAEGEMIELSDGPTGGKNYADGWWEGINAQGERGIFPSNYVELA